MAQPVDAPRRPGDQFLGPLLPGAHGGPCAAPSDELRDGLHGSPGKPADAPTDPADGARHRAPESSRGGAGGHGAHHAAGDVDHGVAGGELVVALAAAGGLGDDAVVAALVQSASEGLGAHDHFLGQADLHTLEGHAPLHGLVVGLGVLGVAHQLEQRVRGGEVRPAEQLAGPGDVHGHLAARVGLLLQGAEPTAGNGLRLRRLVAVGALELGRSEVVAPLGRELADVSLHLLGAHPVDLERAQVHGVGGVRPADHGLVGLPGGQALAALGLHLHLAGDGLDGRSGGLGRGVGLLLEHLLAAGGLLLLLGLQVLLGVLADVARGLHLRLEPGGVRGRPDASVGGTLGHVLGAVVQVGGSRPGVRQRRRPGGLPALLPGVGLRRAGLAVDGADDARRALVLLLGDLAVHHGLLQRARLPVVQQVGLLLVRVPGDVEVAHQGPPRMSSVPLRRFLGLGPAPCIGGRVSAALPRCERRVLVDMLTLVPPVSMGSGGSKPSAA